MEPEPETVDICLPFAVYILGRQGEFRPEWRTEAVVGLARGIVEDSAFERMPILADALEEAGCTDLNLLAHCRNPITHEGGCWALETILRRERPMSAAELDHARRELLRSLQQRDTPNGEPAEGLVTLRVPQGCLGGGCAIALTVAAALAVVRVLFR